MESECQSIEQDVEHGTLREVFSISEHCCLSFFLKCSEKL